MHELLEPAVMGMIDDYVMLRVGTDTPTVMSKADYIERYVPKPKPVNADNAPLAVWLRNHHQTKAVGVRLLPRPERHAAVWAKLIAESEILECGGG